MITEVYKCRTTQGLVIYEIIEGEFGVDSTLKLRDTSCKHYGPNCEVEVVKCEGENAYVFSKALNWTAEEYDYFHKLEKYWATKEDAYVEMMQLRANWNYKDIAEYEKSLEKDTAELEGMQMEKINYFTSEMAKTESTCYVENYGWCKIIGSIQFNNGTVGYLTEDNYYDEGDGYDGDRIILIENKAENRLKTERGERVFVSDFDQHNLNDNKKMERLKKNIEGYQKSIQRLTLANEEINYIIGIRDTLTYEQMKELRYAVEL